MLPDVHSQNAGASRWVSTTAGVVAAASTHDGQARTRPASSAASVTRTACSHGASSSAAASDWCSAEVVTSTAARLSARK